MKTIKFSVVAAAALALSSSAFAADGLTAYGRASGEVGSYFNLAKDSNLIETRSYKSYFGLKGATDVGDGLTAVYQVEVGYNPVNGGDAVIGTSGDDSLLTDGGGGNTGSISNRNSFVGIAGGFGTFVIGNHDTPYKIVARGAGAISSADTVGDLHLQTDRRLTGAVAYIAPADALGGTTLAVAIVPSTGVKAGDTKRSNGYHYSIGALIPVADAGLTFGLGYESAYSFAHDDRINSFFGAATFKTDTISIGLAIENVAAGDDIMEDFGTTTILVPFSVAFGDGLYLNAGIKYIMFDKNGGELQPYVGTIGAQDPDDAIEQGSVVFGKKWASNLDAYVGAKYTIATDDVIGTKNYAFDFGAGLKVSF